MPNISLSFAQKLEICREASRRTYANESYTQQQIAQWATGRFKLPKPPNQTTISRILKSPSKFRTGTATPRKRCFVGKIGRVEKALCNWVIAQYHARRVINGAMIRTVAARMVEKANENASEDKKVFINFSNGRLTRFQARWGLRVLKSHGESGDVNVTLLKERLPIIKEKLRAFNKRDIFNADESGLYFKLAPDRTIACQQMLGRKKRKSRFTFMPCCNADGTEKLALKLIGNANKPRCFRGKSGKELGFDYSANKKAWMTSAIFFEWLQTLDEYIGKTPGRKSLLPLDNCSAHGTYETIPTLRHVEIIFLPPNCTSRIQPLDAGLIAAMKMRYRKKQYELALDLTDEGIQNVYEIDQLTAMRMMASVWENLPGEIIGNCWKHTDLLDNTIHGAGRRIRIADLLCEQEEELRPIVYELTTPATRMDINSIVCAEDGEINAEVFTEEDCVQAAIQNIIGEKDCIENAEAVTTALPSLRDQLRAVAIVKRVLSDNPEICGMGMRVMRRLQRDLRMRSTSKATQTRIDSFFQ